MQDYEAIDSKDVTTWEKCDYILAFVIWSNLQHECQTRATQMRHERHECYTNDTSATRVLHKKHECDMSATQTTRVRHECYTNDTNVNDTSEKF